MGIAVLVVRIQYAVVYLLANVLKSRCQSDCAVDVQHFITHTQPGQVPAYRFLFREIVRGTKDA